jgi:hypothetical protein
MNAQIYSFDTACQTECGGEGNFFPTAGTEERWNNERKEKSIQDKA